MGDAAVPKVVGVRRCRLPNQQPNGDPDEEWIEVTVKAGESCAVYRCACSLAQLAAEKGTAMLGSRGGR